VKERYLVIGRDYVACEVPDPEYKYQGVFVAAIIIKQRRRALNNIYTLNKYLSFYLPYTSILSFVAVDVFSELQMIGSSIFAWLYNITTPITVYCYPLRYRDTRAISITDRNRNSIKNRFSPER